MSDDDWDQTGYYRHQHKRRMGQTKHSMIWVTLFALGWVLGAVIIEIFG